jgi:flagellar protein FliO/FliZ
LYGAVLILCLLGAGKFRLGAQEVGEEAGVPAAESTAAGAPVAGAPAEGTAAYGGAVPAARLDEREIQLGEESPGVPVAAPGPVSGFVILRTVLLLILAAAAVYGLVYLVKRISRPRDTLSPDLRVLATARLGPNRFVHVVALGTRAWLVGAGEGGISHIADVTEQEALDTLLLEESRRIAMAGSGRPLDFRALLRRFGVGARGEVPPGTGREEGGDAGSVGRRLSAVDADGHAENIRRRSDRLRGL